MTIELILTLSILVAIGASLQTITGFGQGLVFAIGASTLDLIPLDKITALAMILSISNILFALKGQKKFTLKECKDVPYVWTHAVTTIVGVWCLYWLIQYPSGYNVLNILLGLFSLLAAVSMFLNPTPRTREIPKLWLHLFYAIGGISGGIFVSAGPFVVYPMYKQPWNIEKIRRTILIAFLFSMITRVLWVVSSGSESIEYLKWALALIPSVFIATHITKKYLHLIDLKKTRYLVLVMLIIGGGNIIIKSIL